MVPGNPESRERAREYLLVLRCQAGDDDAFSDLYDRFGPRSLRYLEGLLEPEEAADAHQEVWLSVFRRISGLNNPRAFKTWLYQITRHRALDALRREKRRSEVLSVLNGEEEGVAPGMDEPHPEVQVLEALGGNPALEAGLGKLAASHREVLLLRYWEEMSYAEVALIVGCSVGTVRSRLHHAKRNLKEALECLRPLGDESAERETAETAYDGEET